MSIEVSLIYLYREAGDGAGNRGSRGILRGNPGPEGKRGENLSRLSFSVWGRNLPETLNLLWFNGGKIGETGAGQKVSDSTLGGFSQIESPWVLGENLRGIQGKIYVGTLPQTRPRVHGEYSTNILSFGSPHPDPELS